MKTHIFAFTLMVLSCCTGERATAQSLPPASQYYTDGRGGLSTEAPPLPPGTHWECGWDFSIQHDVCRVVGQQATASSGANYGYGQPGTQPTGRICTQFLIGGRNWAYDEAGCQNTYTTH